MKSKSSLDAIRKACEAVGGQAEMSRKLCVSSPTVNQWVMGVRPIPAERCPAIEKATGGVVTCEDLRPDVDWNYLRSTSLPQPGDKGASHVLQSNSTPNQNPTDALLTEFSIPSFHKGEVNHENQA